LRGETIHTEDKERATIKEEDYADQVVAFSKVVEFVDDPRADIVLPDCTNQPVESDVVAYAKECSN
jgi:hypothetical protein